MLGRSCVRCTARLQPAYPPLAAQVLDVKPYLRHDIQPDASVPSWCEPVTASSLIREVHFAEAACAALSSCVPRLRLYEDEATVRDDSEYSP